MTWVRLDDKYPNHPKILALSDAAFRLNIQAKCYCSEFLTDGVLPLAWLKNHDKATIQECLDAGVWEITADTDLIAIHDYLDYNPSKEATLAARKKDSDRKSSGRNSDSRRIPDGFQPSPSPSPSPSPLEIPIPCPSPNGSGPEVEVPEVPDREEEIQEVYRHYLEVMGLHPAAYRLTTGRRVKIRTRLTEYTPSVLKKAIDACRASPHHMGTNANQMAYNDLVKNILSNEEKVEWWMQRRGGKNATETH